MTVRAKFYVSEVHRFAYNPNNATVILLAVSRGDQNATWAAATPSGRLEMQVNNPAAVEALELGKEYFIDFVAAPKVEFGDGHAFRAAEVPADHYMSGSCGECGQKHPEAK